MTSQYGAYELHAGHTRLQARTGARARIRTHKYVILLLFYGNNDLRMSVSVTYIGCIVDAFVHV